NGSEVRATGTVSSEQVRARLVAGSTQDALTIDPAVSDEGVADLPAVVDALGEKAKDASVVLNDGRITLSGAVESAAGHDAAIAAAGRVAGAGNVTDQLSVPPPPKEVQQALISLPPITFENGSAILTPAGRTAVAKAADILRANPNVVVRIEGHTDSTG